MENVKVSGPSKSVSSLIIMGMHWTLSPSGSNRIEAPDMLVKSFGSEKEDKVRG